MSLANESEHNTKDEMWFAQFSSDELLSFANAMPFLFLKVGIPILLVFSISDYFFSKDNFVLFVQLRVLTGILLAIQITIQKYYKIKRNVYSLATFDSFVVTVLIVWEAARTGGVSSHYLFGSYLVLVTIASIVTFPPEKTPLFVGTTLLPVLAFLFFSYEEEHIGIVIFHLICSISFGTIAIISNVRSWRLKLAAFTRRKRGEELLFEKELELVKAQSLTELARQVAHDIRSPMMVLNIFQNSSGLNSDEKKLFEMAFKRFGGIADRLLDKSRTVGKVQLAEAVSVEDLSEVLDAIRIENEYIGRSVCYKRVNGPNGRSVKIEKIEFGVILSNLINNAFEARASRVELKLELSDNSHTMTIIVVDDGVGIEPHIVELLNTEPSSFNKSNGNGLGLRHAKGKALDWNATLSIESRIGVGTVVKISIPLESSKSE
jgi:signal transduction histidine kinase